MSQFHEGDYVFHVLDLEHALEVVRVDEWWLAPQLIVRDASGIRHPDETFKVDASMVRLATRSETGEL